MTLAVFLSVLAAAFLHAAWNAAIRSGGDKLQAMFRFTICQGSFGLVLIFFVPWPEAHVWPWILASSVIHLAYQMFLGYAYQEGDLSRVYPIARGSAPMIVLAITLAFALEAVNALETFGSLILGFGILLMARGVFFSGESRRMLPFALGSACATAGYTLVDGLGARVMGDATGYVAWILLGSAVLYTPLALVLQPGVMARTSLKTWGVSYLAGVASFVAYAIVVWGMTQAPIALVAALRETSILFAVLIGWLAFGEKMDRGKAIAALMIVAGVVLIRF